MTVSTDVLPALHQRRRAIHVPQVGRLRHQRRHSHSVQALQIPEMSSCRHVSPRLEPFPLLSLTKLVYSHVISSLLAITCRPVHYEFLCRRRLYDINQVYTASRGGRSPNSIQFCCYYIYIWDSSLPKIVKVETHFLKKTGLCVNKISFLPRDAMYKRGLCRHAVSVCLSVCSSRS